MEFKVCQKLLDFSFPVRINRNIMEFKVSLACMYLSLSCRINRNIMEFKVKDAGIKALEWDDGINRNIMEFKVDREKQRQKIITLN